MADSWYEWLQGSPESEARDQAIQRAEWEKTKSLPMYKALRGMHDTAIYDEARGTTYDPRELRMNMAANSFYPRMGTEAWDDEKAGIDYAFAMGQRVRDTALRAAQEAYQGNFEDAASLAARAPAAALYPPAASGTPGSEDDWRPVARENGVPEPHILGFDLLTDPETYLTAPVAGPMGFVAPAIPMAAAKLGARGLSKADDVLRAVGRAADQAAYGKGATTQLVDDAGEVIRRLRNSPKAPRLRIEYR
jgi:hypothetical protein